MDSSDPSSLSPAAQLASAATTPGQSTMSTTSRYPTPLSVRLAARSGELQSTTASLAPGYIQANLLILPSHHAPSFLLLCQRNPVPCPLLAHTPPGDPTTLISDVAGLPGPALARDIDLRTDAPFYMLYDQGRVVRGGAAGAARVGDVRGEWGPQHVGFLIGCSFGFEAALAAGGLVPRHWVSGRTVPMYRTTVPLNPAGVFTDATYVVSMRPYPRSAIERVRAITRPYALCHGEPIAWGWDGMAKLGIADLERPEWGDAPGLVRARDRSGAKEDDEDDEVVVVPVFWGCGVTPQEAVMKAAGAMGPGLVMAHEPGYMVVLDARDSEQLGRGGVELERS